jgi:ketohexokinase
MIGNCVLDEVWTLRHYPAEDDEMRAENRRQDLGGNACNSAQILAQLGNQVELLATLADDDDADWMLGQLAGLGISTHYCRQIKNTCSPKSVIWLNRKNGSRTIVHHRNLPELSAQDLLAPDTHNLQWVHLEGRNIDTLLEVLPAMKLPCPLSLEIEKPRPNIEKLLTHVDSVIVSKAYLSARDIDARRCIDDFLRINPSLEIICTLGDQGIAAASTQDGLLRIAAQPVDTISDSIGAGDCFIAGFIHQRLNSGDFVTAVQFANRLAANKLEHQGMNIDV